MRQADKKGEESKERERERVTEDGDERKGKEEKGTSREEPREKKN